MATSKKKRTGLDALGISADISSIDTGAKAEKKISGSRRSAAQNIEPVASPIDKSPKKAKSKENWKQKDAMKTQRFMCRKWCLSNGANWHLRNERKCTIIYWKVWNGCLQIAA